MDKRIITALQGKEVVVDITTTGRKTGLPRRIEIWCHRIDDRIIITGSPGRRNWFANMVANPQFTLHLKGAVEADILATARIISDPRERRSIMMSEETDWYRRFVGGVGPLLDGSPLVEAVLSDPKQY